MEKWTLALGIIGALAWIPIIITPVINRFRRVRANLFEFRVLSNGVGISAGERNEKKGAIILMVLNMFVSGIDYYPTRIGAKIRLKDGKKYNAVLSDFSSTVSVNDDGTISQFRLPIDLEFNVSRTIRKNTDNIKCLALLIEGINELALNDLHTIKLHLYSGFFNRKTVVIKESLFPSFNGTQFLVQYEIVSRDNREGTLQERTDAMLKSFQ